MRFQLHCRKFTNPPILLYLMTEIESLRPNAESQSSYSLPDPQSSSILSGSGHRHAQTIAIFSSRSLANWFPLHLSDRSPGPNDLASRYCCAHLLNAKTFLPVSV